MNVDAVVVLALITATIDAAAAGLSSVGHPREYCSIGAEVGYPTRPYNSSTGTCASNYTDVGKTPGRNGMLNNLAFYSMSNIEQPNRLQRVSLILNVNNAAETNVSREALVKAAGAASKKILGGEPAGFAVAIRAGKNSVWTGADWRTEVVYRDWPTGLGHDISVRFIPTGTN